MLKIRLARIGKRKKPTFRFIVTETSRDTYGKALEILGHYNQFSKVCDVQKDRILYWISRGAKLSPTVHNLFVDQNVIAGPKVKASSGKKNEKGTAQTEIVKTAVEPASQALTNETPKAEISLD